MEYFDSKRKRNEIHLFSRKDQFHKKIFGNEKKMKYYIRKHISNELCIGIDEYLEPYRDMRYYKSIKINYNENTFFL